MVDESGTILMANPVSEQMFGYSEGEFKGLQLESLIPMRYRSSHYAARDQYNRSPVSRRMAESRDLMALRKDGSEFPVEVSLSYKTINGRILVMAFITDITERKRSEEAIKRSEEQLLVYAAELEKKVKARTEALDITIDKLERLNHDLQEQIIVRKKAEEDVKKALERERELNELKTKFVSIASHEFRTPLSAVLSSASLIRQYRDKGDLEKIDKHIERIKSSINHLTNILNDFLSLGKLDEGVIDVNYEPVTLSLFLQEVTEELRLTFKEGQDIEVAIEGDESPILSDPKILRNIFFNLISNASKYSGAGKTIFITFRYDEEHTIISFRDEGIGIPTADIKHISDRFFRATNAGNIQGTGLGLNIVKRYVSLLKGNITFTSEYGKGSIFVVTLPTQPNYEKDIVN